MSGWKRTLKSITRPRIYGVLAFFFILAGILWNVYRSAEERKDLGTAFARLERLFAIYSLTSYVGEDQTVPVYVEDLSVGGATVLLQCPEIPWGSTSSALNGALLNCFVAPKDYWLPEAGEGYIGVQISPTEDAKPKIAWESVFGYELYYEVDSVDGQNFLTDEDCLLELEGFSDSLDECYIANYAVNVSGLPSAEDFTFVARHGEILYNDDHTLNRLRDWRVSQGELDFVTLGRLNRFIQIAIREMGIASTDIEVVAPALEAAWRRRDHDFVDGLMKALSASDDLADLAKYLGSSGS